MIRLLEVDKRNQYKLYLVKKSKDISQCELLVTRYVNDVDNESIVVLVNISYRNGNVNLFNFITTSDYSIWMQEDIIKLIDYTFKGLKDGDII